MPWFSITPSVASRVSSLDIYPWSSIPAVRPHLPVGGPRLRRDCCQHSHRAIRETRRRSRPQVRPPFPSRMPVDGLSLQLPARGGRTEVGRDDHTHQLVQQHTKIQLSIPAQPALKSTAPTTASPVREHLEAPCRH